MRSKSLFNFFVTTSKVLTPYKNTMSEPAQQPELTLSDVIANVDDVSATKRRVVYIIRGLPGSGKSTAAELITRMIKQTDPSRTVSTHTTDDYFIRNGQYVYNPRAVGIYHSLNLRAFKKSCEDIDVVIVPNTNLTRASYQPYEEYAKNRGYQVVVLNTKTRDVDVCASRNVHGVTRDTLELMLKKMVQDEARVV